MQFKTKDILSFLIVFITFISVNQWSLVPIGNTIIIWIIDFATIVAVLRYKKIFFHPKNHKEYTIVTFYLIWLIISVLRGVFLIDNYWVGKQLIQGTFALSLPIFVYVFSNPDTLRQILRKWLIFAIPAFLIFFIWVTSPGSKHFYLGPVFLLACFLPIIPSKKWQLLFFGLLIFMLFANFGARSQVIKASFSLLLIIVYLYYRNLSDRILHIVYWLLMVFPLILLGLGISGVFNLFSGLDTFTNERIVTHMEDGHIVEENLSADTRTFIYVEVIQSAMKNGYIFWGRTPARGNDSDAFGVYMSDDLKTGLNERHSNELCFPNVFTWLGFVGMVLYCLIYLKSSYLAVYKSNNLYIKLIGLLIAFHFLFGWIEDTNRFDIMGVSLWMMIGMGFSERFRSMNNKDFKLWINSIFYKL